jgi:hypothetical protein
MSRKTEQEIIVDGQIRFWEDKLRKARTVGNQLKIAAVLKQLRAERWPSPTDEAIAVAKVEKLKAKNQKKADAQAKPATPKVELEWLARPNVVVEQHKRGRVQAQMREDRTEAEAEVSHPIECVTVVPDGGDSAAATEAVVAPSASTEVTVSPDMQRIHREAETAAKRHSTGLDVLKSIMRPLEPREAWDAAGKHQPAILTESSGPRETYARLGSHVEAQPDAPGDWETVTDGFIPVRRLRREE